MWKTLPCISGRVPLLFLKLGSSNFIKWFNCMPNECARETIPFFIKKTLIYGQLNCVKTLLRKPLVLYVSHLFQLCAIFKTCNINKRLTVDLTLSIQKFGKAKRQSWNYKFQRSLGGLSFRDECLNTHMRKVHQKHPYTVFGWDVFSPISFGVFTFARHLNI